MRKVFESHKLEHVGLSQSILEEAGILTLMKNEHICATEGTFSRSDNVIPELWVMNDGDYERAMELLTAFNQPPPDIPPHDEN
ncbi:MAG: DUF2007 domain-containing protein [Verrucomicrobiota bacterium]